MQSQEVEEFAAEYFVSNSFEILSRMLKCIADSYNKKNGMIKNLHQVVDVKEYVMGIGEYRDHDKVFETGLRKFIMKFYGNIFGKVNRLRFSTMAQKIYYNVLKLNASHSYMLQCSKNARRGKLENQWGFLWKPKTNNSFSKKSREWRDKKYAKKRDFFLMVNRHQWSCFLKHHVILPHQLKGILLAILSLQL